MNGNISHHLKLPEIRLTTLFNYLNYSEHILCSDIPVIVTWDFNATENLCRET